MPIRILRAADRFYSAVSPRALAVADAVGMGSAVRASAVVGPRAFGGAVKLW